MSSPSQSPPVPPVPFRAIGVEDFNVVPIRADELASVFYDTEDFNEYTIVGVSSDGTRWQTMGPDGKLGWFPAKMCQYVGPSPQQSGYIPGQGTRY